MYFPNTSALLFVVDSADPARMLVAREQLHRLLEVTRHMQKESLRTVPLLVIANKQDLPNASTDKDISDTLALARIHSREWALFPCCAPKGTGLNQALDWLVDRLSPSR